MRERVVINIEVDKQHIPIGGHQGKKSHMIFIVVESRKTLFTSKLKSVVYLLLQHTIHIL